MFKVLVCGSRKWNDKGIIAASLCALKEEHKDLMIIQGGADGADKIAKLWAHHWGVMEVTVDANWGYYHNAAGPVRNRWMLELAPDLVLAYPLPGSKGTYNMVEAAIKAEIKVIIHENNIMRL